MNSTRPLPSIVKVRWQPQERGFSTSMELGVVQRSDHRRLQLNATPKRTIYRLAVVVLDRGNATGCKLSSTSHNLYYVK
jgi:hypothetical protein